MITVLIENCASLLPSLAKTWIDKTNAPSTTYPYADYFDIWDAYDDEEDYDYVNQMWLNAFGIHGTHPTDEDDEDDEEYQNYLENTEVISSGIWDDDKEWGRVAELYDSYDKSTGAINSIMRSPVYNEHGHMKHKRSKLFQDIDKNKEKEEKNWRQDVLNEVDSDDRKIYYYDNPRNENSKHEFTEIDDFLMFCEDNNISVDTFCKNDIEFYTQCHCGLDEYALNNGRKDLRCSRSYGELMYDLYGSDLFYDGTLDYANSQTNNKDELPF